MSLHWQSAHGVIQRSSTHPAICEGTQLALHYIHLHPTTHRPTAYSQGPINPVLPPRTTSRPRWTSRAVFLTCPALCTVHDIVRSVTSRHCVSGRIVSRRSVSVSERHGDRHDRLKVTDGPRKSRLPQGLRAWNNGCYSRLSKDSIARKSRMKGTFGTQALVHQFCHTSVALNS